LGRRDTYQSGQLVRVDKLDAVVSEFFESPTVYAQALNCAKRYPSAMA